MSGRLISLLLVLATVTGCAFPGERRMSPPERALAPPAALGERVFEQLVSVTHEGDSQTLIAAGQMCEGAFTLALVTPEGMEILRLRHDQEGVHTRVRRELPDRLRATAILADLQLVYWPAGDLRAAWSDKWSLHENASGRILHHGGEPILAARFEGDPWTAPVTLEHLRAGYRIGIRTLHHEAAAGDKTSPCRADTED